MTWKKQSLQRRHEVVRRHLVDFGPAIACRSEELNIDVVVELAIVHVEVDGLWVHVDVDDSGL